jgi:hypothetical protein
MTRRNTPEEHYGWGLIDVEAVVERPIALDAQVMARRGAGGSSLLPHRRWP